MLAPLSADEARRLLSPSARVLVACAAPDDGVGAAGALPWSDVHWPTLLALASWERAEGALHRLLRAAPPGSVPADVLQAIQGVSRVAAFRADELAQAAGQTADALHAAGIDTLWLKGAALAVQSPRGFSVRAMGDIDLLVAPGQRERAGAVLRGAGWADGGGVRYAAHHHDAPFTRPPDLRLELHDAMFPPGHPFTADAHMAWLALGRPVAWSGRTVRVLPPAWHVVHACLHWAWSHEGEVGSWQFLHDMHRLITAELDWGEVRAAARAVGGEPVVGMALWAAERLAGVPVPAALVTSLRGGRRGLDGVAERVWVLRAFQSPMASPSVRWSRYWWRRAVRGVGDATRAWPWSAGREATAEPGAEAGHAEAGHRRGARVAGWRRHLGRLLRG